MNKKARKELRKKLSEKNKILRNLKRNFYKTPIVKLKLLFGISE